MIHYDEFDNLPPREAFDAAGRPIDLGDGVTAVEEISLGALLWSIALRVVLVIGVMAGAAVLHAFVTGRV